jgi:hypothetical protein
MAIKEKDPIMRASPTGINRKLGAKNNVTQDINQYPG